MGAIGPGGRAGDGAAAATFLGRLLRDELDVGAGAKVLDFGCGSGGLVAGLVKFGFDMRGCDVGQFWDADPEDRLSLIEQNPYRLPHPDAAFDAVISTSVLEHAQNKDELFREIHRVLRPGGLMLHLYPGKYYLPTEPHIYVPLVSWMWPRVPRAWLALWAILGTRNEFQQGLPWRQVVMNNAAYCETGLSYWSERRYRSSLRGLFVDCTFPQRLYVRHADGGAARLARRLPFQDLTGAVLGKVRMNLLLARKGS
jgi:SAM-dependent methyltransferase